MIKTADQFKINLNQNLWVLLASLTALGFSEYFHLEKLQCVSWILSIVSSISVFVTLIFYTLNYCKKKAG